jgi:hypothetical protein
VSAGSLIDVLSGSVATHERYSLDVGVSADVGHSVSATLDDVDDAIGHAGLLEEVEEDFHGAGDLLGRLHDVSVTKGDGKGEHPQGAHIGEVEGGYSFTHYQGDSVAVQIDSLGNVAEGLTLGKRGETAGVLDHLETSENVTLSINQGFTVLEGNELSDFILL